LAVRRMKKSLKWAIDMSTCNFQDRTIFEGAYCTFILRRWYVGSGISRSPFSGPFRLVARVFFGEIAFLCA
jgi:hypothetical protein